MTYPTIYTILLLVGSNLFMTFAWYAHLRNLATSPIWMAILLSWLVASLEYMLQVPANRIGYLQAHLSLPQLKFIQEIITLIVFVPFTIFYMKQALTWNYLWASLCLLGAGYFIFIRN